MTWILKHNLKLIQIENWYELIFQFFIIFSTSFNFSDNLKPFDQYGL